jgi:molybdopterin molybdotransferase
MIRLEEAIEIVSASVVELGAEKVLLEHCLNRVLAEDIVSDINMPPFNKSAVDGYACRAEDIDMELEVIEVIQAGQTPTKSIAKGQCAQIMTGAPVPNGADKIVMVEHIEIKEGKIKALRNQKKSNISILAEDVKQGDIVLPKASLLKPQHIAILASVGYAELMVYKMPIVGVLSTGDELVEPNQKPDISKIRNSNGPQLVAQIKSMGLNARYYGIAKDTPKHTLKKIQDALSECDIVLLTGGVSMGEFDFVPEVLIKLGVKLHFESIAIKPGKPTVYGTYKEKYLFGLPGNPVSSFVLFEILVKNLIYKLMGYRREFCEIKLPLGEPYRRERPGRLSFIPIKIKNGEVFPVKYHGSGHIHSLYNADGFINIPIGVEEVKKGELMDVRQI